MADQLELTPSEVSQSAAFSGTSADLPFRLPLELTVEDPDSIAELCQHREGDERERFAQRAKQDGKRIVELESIEGQLTLLDSFSPELQEGMLRATVDGIKDGSLARDVHELVSAWSAGNPDRLMDQVDKEVDGLPAVQAAEMRERLYDARNREMADRIVAMLAGREPTFVAIGVGHVLGPSGIVELLRKRGYQVKKL
jgi:uncharacterized protein YbaP (TraB family)